MKRYMENVKLQVNDFFKNHIINKRYTDRQIDT